jgi:hypothetical protein
MGRLQAEEVIELTDLDTALSWHLQHNHYPPVPSAMKEPAKKAIALAREAVAMEDESKWGELVDMPEGIECRGRSDGKAEVRFLIESLHLESFLDTSEEAS